MIFREVLFVLSSGGDGEEQTTINRRSAKREGASKE
jgi:hypothetical protein